MIDDLFRRQHGVASRAQARAVGLSNSAIARRTRTGEWQRADRGVFRHRAVPPSWEAELLTRVLAADGVASHRAAARLWGIDDGRFDTIELSIERGRTYRRSGVVTHELTQMDLFEPALVRAIPATPVDRTILDLGAVLRFGQLEMAADAALRQRLTTWPRLHETLHMHSRRGRDGCGRLRALLEERYGDPVVPLSRWGREVARWAITTNLPRPQVEYRIVDAAGDFVAQVDVAWPEQRVALELDSVQFHLNRTSFERDPRRRNQVIAHGWDLRTCTWDMWVHDRPTLRRQLWEALMLHSRTA